MPVTRHPSRERPQRIQLRRSKGWRLPALTVVVARPTRWGNPFRVGVDGDASVCVQRFRDWVQSNSPGGRGPTLDAIRASLAGRNLACWCALDQPCHADVLLDLANP